MLKELENPLEVCSYAEDLTAFEPPFWRIIQNVTNIQDVHLSSQALVGGINGYNPSVPATSGMKVYSKDPSGGSGGC